MSECVVRMEKPTSCDDCDIADRFGNEIYCPFLGWYADYDKCPVFLQLPEGHGRLVDADALLRDIEKYHVSEGKFQHWLELQPTIVPAEAESPSPKPADPFPIRGVEYVPTEVDVQTGTVTYELRERSET